jgi:predicted transposase YbfD/YdcC
MSKIGNTILSIKESIKGYNIDLSAGGIPKKPIKKLIRFLKEIPDNRNQSQVSYPLHEIILTAFLAIMAGAETIVDIANFAMDRNKWLKEHFFIKQKSPSHDTFRRVLSIIDPFMLQNATVTFLIDNIKVMKRAFGIDEPVLKQYCVDGKTSRGTGRLKDTEREIKQLQTLHVYDRTDGICLVSKAIDEKTNEIPVAQDVLRLMDLRGAIVTFDSLNTQIDTVAAVVDQKGDYVAALKGNQPDFFNEVVSYFNSSRLNQIKSGGNNYLELKEKKHNCIELRKYYLTKNVSWLLQVETWKGLKSLIHYTLHTEDINTGKTTEQKHYYISSSNNIKICADAIRGQWSVENELHWHLDVNFFEDSAEIIDRVAAQNFSLLRKMALSLFKLIAPIIKSSVRSSKKRVGWDSDILLKAFQVLDEDTLTEALASAKIK